MYAEFVGKAYGDAKVYNKGQEIIIADVPQLESGYYLEFRPSVQFIFHSNLRVDFSVATPLINRSFVRVSPAFYFSIQRYFYFK